MVSISKEIKRCMTKLFAKVYKRYGPLWNRADFWAFSKKENNKRVSTHTTSIA
jgi:hypothetical protein